MYPAKAPVITTRIEQRIRRGFYQDTLPVNELLQNEFQVAKQTLTEALRPLFTAGVLSCTSPRSGIQIVRNKLQTGTIAVVSGTDIGLEDRKLIREIQLDNFAVKLFLPSDTVKFHKEDADKFCGILFINSALTKDIADEIKRLKVPFVSCNRIDFADNVSWIDYNQEANMRFIIEYLLERNYRRLGFFYSSPLVGFNEHSMKIVRRLKREYGLPTTFYDRFVSNINRPAIAELNKLLNRCADKNEYPEVLIGKSNFVSELTKFAPSVFPSKMKFIYHRAFRERIPPEEGAYSFYFSRINWHLWLQGYQLLREMMLAPSNNTVRRFMPNRILIDTPIPTK